jgi:O-antigen ligase
MTALIMTVVLIAVRVVGPFVTRTRREAIPFILYSVGFCIVMIATSVTVILPLLGRDLTFTGRTRVWAVLFPFAINHFWLGYGYQGFWNGTSGDSGSVNSILNAALNTADNGYLQLMLELGFVSIVLLVVLLIACVRDFQTLLRRSSVPLIAYWYAGLILAIFVGSITEDMLWMPFRIVPFMLVLACAGLRNLTEQHADL